MKYFKTALVLCLIAGLCAILIAAVNLVTSPIIKQNKIDKENKACSEIYEDAFFTTVEVIDSDSINKIWKVEKNNTLIGYIYSLSGKNSYGTVSLLVGINLDGSIEKVILTENTQSYASVVKKHVTSTYNGNAKINSINDVDVNCGATFGATLVKELITEAINYEGDR